MRLAVIERVLLGGMLALHKDNFTILKQVREAREAVSFNDIENAKLKMVQLGNDTQWNPEAAIEIGEVEIEFAEPMIEIIRKTLKDLNDQAQLTDQHFTLYEKFVEGETN